MPTKKTGPTLASLNAQIAALQRQAEALRAKEVAEVVARIREAIDHYGLTAADLGLRNASSKSSKTARSVPAKKARAKSGGRKAPRSIKFADRQGKVCRGSAKRPNWFRAALASGTKPEELLARPAG